LGYAVFARTEVDAQKIVKLAAKNNLKAVIAGHVEKTPTREVVIKPLNVTLKSEGFTLEK